MVYLHFPTLIAELQAKLHVLTKRLRFLLCKRSHYRKQNLAFCVQGVDVLFLEEYGNITLLKLTYVFKAVKRISGKSADGLCDNHVDFAVHAVCYHTVEFLTLFGIRAGDTVIGVNTRKCPFGVSGDLLCIMRHLRFVAGRLLIAVRADTAVRSHTQLWFFRFIPL